MTTNEEFLVFPGCMIGNRLPYLEKSARLVFEKLGLKPKESSFSCCPDPIGIQGSDHTTWLSLGARNLSLAEAENKNIVSLCNGCTQTLTVVNHELKHSEQKRNKINKILKEVGKEFKGTIDVSHFLTYLLHEVGVDAIKKKVVKPLTGLKVACHTGCHYMRPTEIMGVEENHESPQNLRKVVTATGATVVDWDEEHLCCGYAIERADPDVSYARLKGKLDSAIKGGADIIVAICPTCFSHMDNNQRNLTKKYETEYKTPVLYLTEILALAMGFSSDEIGLKNHRSKGDLKERFGGE
ncbi:MAG: CoB--CoM heterodisulfide reductase subunit B [Promethearchaeota archaeon]|nr:MAG: CoB--CoM heterodisulfide reductase subunit B [Candidatus Lokiarchaeota archaeon]